LVTLNDGTEIHLIEADVDRPGEKPHSALVASLIDPGKSASKIFVADDGPATLWLSRAAIPHDRMHVMAGGKSIGLRPARPGSAGGEQGTTDEVKE